MVSVKLRTGVIGATVGLILAAGVAAPSAAATTSTTTSVSCGALNGLTVTAPSYGVSGVVLNAGDKITAKASPATSTDLILLAAATPYGLAFVDGPATTGVVFTAPAAASYGLSWTWEGTKPAPTNLTWTFTSVCSSTAIAPSPTPTTAPKPGKGKGKR